MPSRFETDFASRAAPKLFDMLGDADDVSYTRYSDMMLGTVTTGFPVTIEAIFKLERTYQIDEDDGIGEVREATFKIYADATNGVADPQIETDAITRDSVVWTVREINSLTGGVATLTASTYEHKKTGASPFELTRVP